MSNDVDRLTGALADRYAIERELGRGGMATVYLAEDLRHHRPVAIKVLKPELAQALGPDRFLREIEVTAQLHHPMILPLLDSGEADGTLYYVMPFVEGESLRDRLERERQLPLEDALQITKDVAEALSYAHSRGVIHRDIKPENVLLESGHALVADFGIAKAVTEAGGERLTGTGVSIGTPAYMSPEQAEATKPVDARSDLYSLGCVLYEMLAGHPPFVGTTAHELIVRHASDPVPPLRSGRSAVPEPIEDAVEKALAKVPADRYATAQQFQQALGVDTKAYRRLQRRRRWLKRVGSVAAAVVVLVAGTYGTVRYRSINAWKRVPLDSNAVVVLPFEVRGSGEEVRSLDEKMQYLLEPLLDGEVGPRAVDIWALMRRRDDWQDQGRWRGEDAPVRLAASFNAGLLLEGAVVEVGRRLLVNALLRLVPNGREVARASVEIDPDSLSFVPRRLLVELLGKRLGEDEERLAQFERQDPKAVDEYLKYKRQYRKGRYEDGMRYFEHALEIDSTFAAAAMRLAETAYHPSVSLSELRRRYQQVEALRNRLSPRDRLALDFVRPDTLDDATWLASAEAWVRAAPESGWAWFQYARALAGNVLGRAGAIEDAQAALEHSWMLDSVTAGVVGRHVHEVLQLGFIDWLRRIAPRYLAIADTTDRAWPAHRWVLAIVTGDSATVRRLRSAAQAGTSPELTSGWVAHRLMWLCMEGLVGCDDARLVTDRVSPVQDDYARIAGT